MLYRSIQHHFSRPHLSNGRVVVMVVVRPSIRHGCTVAKRCNIQPGLLLITNKKSHTGFQITYKSLTLDDLESHWQLVSLAILATAGLFGIVVSLLLLIIIKIKTF